MEFVHKLRTPYPVFCERLILLNGPSDDFTSAEEQNDDLRILNYVFTGDLNISELRNQCKKYAKGNWIIWQDADDMLCLCNDEYEEIRNMPDDVFGIEVPVIMFDRADEKMFIDYQIKIHRDSELINFEYACHETVRNSFDRHNLKVIRRDYLIKHFGYNNADRLREHLLRNRDMIIKDLASEYVGNEFLLKKLYQTLTALN
jgi:glycosyltransferase involved in cell wall biosynthesis